MKFCFNSLIIIRIKCRVVNLSQQAFSHFVSGSGSGFTSAPNTFASGGTPNNAQTVAACQAACVASNPRCFAVDFNPSTTTKCYLHTDEARSKQTQAGTGITHYTREATGRV